MTPIEAAARAISDAITETPEHWRDWIHEARAAIAAIREPSKAMTDGARALFRRSSRPVNILDADAIWTAMNDAALAEGPDA